MSPAWSFALLRLAGAVAIALLLGLLTGHTGWWLVAVLGGLLAWNLANLYLLQRWLRHRSTERPPDLQGIWGDLVGLIGGLHRRKQFHKQRVRQLLREFRRLSAALPEGVVLLTMQGEILWFNRTAARLLGLKRKADFGMSIVNLIRQPGFGRLLQEAAGGEPWVLPSRERGGRSLALVVIRAGEQKLLLVRDVTREARVEQMRVDFVANASHELRSPLTVISGYLDALAEEEALAGSWQAPVAEMRRQAERMRLVIEDLLELSRLESAPGEAPHGLVDMPALLQRRVESARAQPGAGERAAVELELASRDKLLGDERVIDSIVGNLLSNALKYTPAGGRVTLGWRADAGGARLTVQDTGVGIATEHLPRLTERFYRADRGRSRSEGGSGLGLAIVKHGLQRHGARLEVHSREGEGSVFTAVFPAGRVHPG